MPDILPPIIVEQNNDSIDFHRLIVKMQEYLLNTGSASSSTLVNSDVFKFMMIDPNASQALLGSDYHDKNVTLYMQNCSDYNLTLIRDDSVVAEKTFNDNGCCHISLSEHEVLNITNNSDASTLNLILIEDTNTTHE